MYIYISLIFITVFSFAKSPQESRTMTSPKTNLVENTCSEMKSQAIEDLKAGKYKLYEFGIVSSPDTNVAILKQIDIELISSGCNVTDGIDCYRAIMDSAIRVKYKNEIIEYPNEGFDRIRFKREFFNLTDSVLLVQNAKKITRVLNALSGLTKGKAFVQIYINKEGKPVKIKWLGSLDKKNELIINNRLIKERFETLTIGKDKMNTILTLPIKIE